MNNISEIFQKGLEGYKVAPSKSLWAAIRQKLWFQGFIRFSAGSFNVYYASSILVASIVGSVAIINNTPDNATIADQSENIDRNTETLPDWIETKDNYYLSNNSTDQAIHKRDNTHTPEPQYEKTETLRATPQVSDAQLNPGSNDIPPIANEITEEANPEKSLSAVNQKQPEETTSIASESAGIIHADQDKQNQNETPSIENVTEKNNSEVVKNAISEEIENINLPELEAGDITVYDTVRIYDTLVFYDTVSVRLPLDKKSLARISVDVFAGANSTNFNYNHAVSGFEDTLNNFTSASSGYQAGINLNLHLRRFEISTGFNYQQIEEDFAYELISIINNPIEYWEYSETGTLHTIDTTDWIFIFNSEDSSFVSAPVIHETWTAQYDSNLVSLPVYTIDRKNYDNLNKYTYINIPLSVGYQFYDREKISLSARAGGNLGIFINAKGKGISWIDRKSIIQLDNDELPFAKTNFSWMLGLAANYRFDEKLSITVEPWYRGSLNSMFDKNHPVSVKANPLGLNIGLRFHL